MGLELAEEVLHVVANRVLAQHELTCDGLVALAVSEQLQHFTFAFVRSHPTGRNDERRRGRSSVSIDWGT